MDVEWIRNDIAEHNRRKDEEIARLRAELEAARVDAERLSSAMRGASVIGRSELSMMMNALRRDAEERPCRGEMVAEAEKSLNKYADAVDAARGGK